MPGVVGAHIDRIASNHGTTKRFGSQLDTPDDVPTGGRYSSQPEDCPPGRLSSEWGRDGRRWHNVRRDRRSRCDSSDSTNAHSASLRSAGSLAAAFSASRTAVYSLRCFPELRPRRFAHRGIRHPELRSTAALQTAPRGRCWRGPHMRPIERREPDRPGRLPRRRRLGRRRTDGRQGFCRVDADVWILVRKSIDEGGYRRAGSPAERAEGARGIARDDQSRRSGPASTPVESIQYRASGQRAH